MPENKVYEFLFRRPDGMISLKKGLDAYALRQKAFAANIANAETPNYVAKKVEFEDELRKALDQSSRGMVRTHPDHIPVRAGLRRLEAVTPRISNADTPRFYNGVNNVDIDVEMARMATNQIHFTAAAKVLGQRYRMIKSAILGRAL
ncbi:MAG TPA: flagellar basal body rod protein FlgB [Bacteroidetes bacterium]|nr:flagellar basal body rod protein FlgB [Bacteroidota bacterium]